MPPWLGWLMIVALLSGITTSCDSYLLTISSVVANDVLRPLSRHTLEDATVLRSARIAVLVAALVAYLISVQDLPLIAIASLQLCSVWGATVFVPLYGAFFWQRGTAVGALASSLMGLTVSMTWIFTRPIAGTGYEAIAGLIAALVTYAGVSLLIQKTSVPVREPAV